MNSRPQFKPTFNLTKLFGVSAPIVSMPGEWSGYVSGLRCEGPTPLCLGAVPQSLRDLADLKPQAKPHAAKDVSFELFTKARMKSGTAIDLLLVAACQRIVGEFDNAQKTLDSVAAMPGHDHLKIVLPNERAALEWARGNVVKAWEIWKSMPDSAVTLFNRGICEWQAGQTASASTMFDRAAALIPDRSGWSHLAALYAALCEGV